MAQMNSTSRLPFGAVTAHRIGSFFWRVNARMAERRAARATLDEVSRLDARQLDDIGLTGEDIAALERAARYF